MSTHVHRYIGCLHEIEIDFFKQYVYLFGRKIKLDTKCIYNMCDEYGV